MCHAIIPVAVCQRCYRRTLIPEPRLKLCEAAARRGCSCRVTPADPPELFIVEGGGGCVSCQPDNEDVHAHEAQPAGAYPAGAYRNGAHSNGADPAGASPADTTAADAPPPYYPGADDAYPPNINALDDDEALAYALQVSELEEQSRLEREARRAAEQAIAVINDLLNDVLQAQGQNGGNAAPVPPVAQHLPPVVHPRPPVVRPKPPVIQPPNPPAPPAPKRKSKDWEIRQCPSMPPYMSKKDKWTTINGRKYFVRQR